ncbi:MAG: PilZ domain-containing protein [Clostridiaceae bacterium]|nr:PilZ domain-containing protein [Clostridiaceae bacterium]
MRNDLLYTILKEGVVVYTRLSASNFWHQNIVYKVENNSVSLALIPGYLESIIMTGQTLTIKLTNEDIEYLFIGHISEIRPHFPSLITVDIKNIKDLKNCRVFPRYDVYVAASIKSENSDDDHFAIIHDISLSGMAFYSKKDFSIASEQLNLTIFLPNKNIIVAKGTVTRKMTYDSYIDYGMSYTDMQEENNNSLYDFFSMLEVEKSKLRDTFFKSIKKHLP